MRRMREALGGFGPAHKVGQPAVASDVNSVPVTSGPSAYSTLRPARVLFRQRICAVSTAAALAARMAREVHAGQSRVQRTHHRIGR
jgi:hypothetical protein